MEFVDQVFEGGVVRLDFNRFVRCRFENCELVFSAVGPVSFEGCTFGNKVSWRFLDAAGRMLEFLHGMYNGTEEGGQQFVENVFDTVRGGK
ncbi:MAG TPA: hypothetical protein VLA19_29805 [Herpetosiphonaceae bacterium]|nr:hypothetical protein [Herpetosiphonaceae bacterium]